MTELVELFDNATSPGTSTVTIGPIGTSDVILPVKAAASPTLQQPSGQFRIVVLDPISRNMELMLVYSDSAWTFNWSVMRAIESSSGPFAFPAGSIVRHILTAGALANLLAQGGVINPPPPGSIVEQVTVDTDQLFKIILFGDGTVTGIPAGANAPATPTGLEVSALHLTFVTLQWDTAARASTYRIYRDGTIIGTSSLTNYTDSTVQIGHTYTYTVQALDQYDQPSSQSTSVSADVDASLDQPPEITVTIYPDPIPAGSVAVVRVNSYSLDALTLADTLGVNVGQLTSTWDGSTWLLTV